MPKTLEADGSEYGTLERRPMEEESDPLEALLSWGLGICLGPSKSFFLGGFVIRRVLLLVLARLVSLQRQLERISVYSEWLCHLLYQVGDMSICASTLPFYT